MPATATPTAPLTGPALLDAIKALGPATKAEICQATGYVTVNKKDGTPRFGYTRLQEALLEAKGFTLDVVKGAPAGRELSFRARQQKNSNLVIGAGYMLDLGYEPGQLFSIEVNKEAGSITVTAIDEEEGVEAEEEGED